ncbi:hypothetical protein PTKIN_Ptkin11bG0064000 [Pterospermum kingtungense]
MGRLTKEGLLKDDPHSITSLSLHHKALSDVSCLSEFKNLERLDLAFNILTSLQGLESCVSLKWLSVVQNKLQTLKGIEGLTKLTVLNAGKNKLRSMEEVRFLVNLRALILNDNEIVSICGLDQMKDLNTLVLSRNPISEIGDSLAKLKSITKNLPAELSYNKKLQNLDLGNNLIARWSDLKALDSLVNLKNLNLQGNPIAQKDKLAKKVEKLLPNLHIFNAKPIDKSIKSEMGDSVDIASHNAVYKEDIHMEEKKDQKRKRNSKVQASFEKQDVNLDGSTGLDAEKEMNRKKKKGNDKASTEVLVEEGDDSVVKKKEKKKKAKGEQENLSHLEVEKKIIDKGRKTKDKLPKNEVSVHEDGIMVEEKPKKKKLEKHSELDIIDDAGTSFTELFANDVEDPKDDRMKIVDRAGQDMESSGGLVTYPVKKKKSKRSALPELNLSPVVEVGMGGASTWDD